MKRLALSLFLVASFAAPTRAANYIVYIGSYTDAPSTSKGVYAARFDSVSGALTPIGPVAETINPAYLSGSADGRFLYAVNWKTPAIAEGKLDTVTAYAVDRKSGSLTLLNQVSAGGNQPNEAIVDPSGKVLVVANYGAGGETQNHAGISAIKLGADGRLADPFYIDLHPHEPIAARRPGDNPGAHTHGIAFSADHKYVFIADLGLDRIYTYNFDASKPVMSQASPAFVLVSPNSGPRRLAVSADGKFLYCNYQDNSKVGVFRIGDKGSLQNVQEVATVPADYKGRNTTAEIAIDKTGKFLYVSNRGHNSIAVYGVDPASGKLTALEYVSALGNSPRNMAFDPTGAYLFVANQSSSNLVVFKYDSRTGHLTPTGDVMAVPEAAGVFFVKQSD